MPIYEYRCEDCDRVQSFLVRKPSEFTPRCKKCGGDRMERLISRVAVVESEETKLERLADPSAWGDVDENDPASVAKFVKKMGGALGEDVGDVDELAAEIEAEAASESASGPDDELL